MMGIIDNAKEALRFKDTIFIKEDSDLQNKYDALKRLNSEYPENKELLEELFMVKKGLEGENEIAYQLKKSNMGMYVIRDLKVEYEGLKAQIDYVVITPVYTYYIECKNLIGNITVNEKGDFIREYTYNGEKIKKGMYSPLRQVEAQREVIKKISESRKNVFEKLLFMNVFDKYKKVLVVAANHETILDTKKAPSDMKYKILRSDGLLRQLEYDYNHKPNNEYLCSKKDMEEAAKSYLEININDKFDYYDYYKNKYCKTNDLKERLLEFRKNRSSDMNIPAYYVFTNEELDKMIECMPRNIDELRKILPEIKVKTHGELIIKEINKR